MRLVKDCVQPGEGLPQEAVTVAAPLTTPTPVSTGRVQRGLGRDSSRDEEPAAAHVRFRRAFDIGSATWTSFCLIDWSVVRYLHAGRFLYFLSVRIAVLLLIAPVIWRLHRPRPLSKRILTFIDVGTFTAAAVGLALMCVEFRGIASPYIPGLCLHLLARTVTARDEPWRRALLIHGLPVVSFFVVLLGSALFAEPVARQLLQPESVATFALYATYVMGTGLSLVVGSHLTWALRRQIFEARNLGRYRLRRLIATGGMGEVWLAYHPGLKRDVAVKILKPEEQERSQSALARFEREVRATAELEHPNTVRVFDYGVTDDGLWYYVMELLEGETIASHVSRLGPLPPARAVHIVGQAARALAEAHGRGIVHRDIKPENLFLTSMGGEHDFVKVIDFGIAKVANADGNMTGTGWVLGTPAYMSPEVATGAPADARSDVYGLGEVLYYMVCGRPPFKADNIAALIFAQVHDVVISPSRILGRQLPQDVEAVLMRALEKDPDARFPTAAEFAMALASCTQAGAWTFGDAALVARYSSRPPSVGTLEALKAVSLRPPRVPVIQEEGEEALPRVSGARVEVGS
jgi:serine/threonine-protein kinase